MFPQRWIDRRAQPKVPAPAREVRARPYGFPAVKLGQVGHGTGYLDDRTARVVLFDFGGPGEIEVAGGVAFDFRRLQVRRPRPEKTPPDLAVSSLGRRFLRA